MPKFDTSTPTITRKFSDITFAVPAVFTTSHTFTQPEIDFLNGQVASVVGNAYSGDLRRAVLAVNVELVKAQFGDKASAEFAKSGKAPKGFTPTTIADLNWDHAAKFAEKFADYELGVSNRGSGGEASTPLGRMITFLAGEELKARIARKGLKVAAFYKAKSADGETSKWAELLAQLIDTKREDLTAQAQAQLDAMAANDAEGEDDLLDGVDLSPETEAEEPQPED